jgi:hypothetical protein
MKRILALLIVTNVLWFVFYASLEGKYRDILTTSKSALSTLPDTKTYYVGQQKDGDLVVMCINKVDPTVRGSQNGYNLLNISCGGN